MRLLIKVLAFVCLSMIVVSCKQETNLEEPPEILFGEDSCDECAMIISEPRYAASYVTQAGDVYRFDDIGGMLLHDQKHEEDVYVYWVHDFNSEKWIKARPSVLVLNSGQVTPMGWGLVAFEEQSAAEAYVSEHGGRIEDFAEIQQLVRSGELDPSTLSSINHEHDMDSEMGEMELEDGG